MRVPDRAGAVAAKLAALLGAATLATAGAAVLAGPASAATSTGDNGARWALFVQTDNSAGNQVVAYHRAGNGTLTLAGTYDTGGLGGQLTGSVVDHLASQGGLTYDPRHGLLYAVNAGSNTVTVFAASGDRLYRKQVVSSGGDFPVSVAVHGGLVYVLNALNGGSVQGYRVSYEGLSPLPGSNRPLGLDPSATPQFVNTPGQIAFTPNGSALVVTTKANGDDIDVFALGANGRPAASPVVNPEPGTVPFAITFDRGGHLVIANAGTDALATYAIHGDGTVTLLNSVGTGQTATCWVAPAQDHGLFFASNAASASVSGYSDTGSGTLTLLGQAATDPGTVDAAATPGGRFLYVQTGGNGMVDEFSIDASGALTNLGSVTVAGAAGGEGITAA
ncbi:MAG TPA: beta-propeller fold lactonase family protein [Streptosporangiaceae bacterium]|nr:beta-propeller fold lactonase family protein [Streptosporangiaceae bacterium]